MSHVVTVKTRVTDPAALAAACRRLGLAGPEPGTATLFAGQEATGLIVRLPGWLYPAVVDVAAGEVRFDTFNGAWGSPHELDRLLQAYAVEKATAEAWRAGHSVAEHLMADGSVRLTLRVGNGGAI